MLDKNIIEQLKGIFANPAAPVTLAVTGVAGRDDTRQMLEFAEDFASASEALNVKFIDGETIEKAPVMKLMREGEDTGVAFCGIPNGHEFTSLILAVLNADGKGKNLPDDSLRERITRIKGPVDIYTFVSLTCTNCPDVVQALNVVALLNPGITHTTVDGAVAQQMVADYNVQSVPTVYANGQLLSVGRSDLGELVAKLDEKFGSEAVTSAPRTYNYDAVVIGAGPSGSAAAIYMARKGLKTAVVAGRVGGQVKDTMEIENLVSVPLTTGPKLAVDIRTHLEKYDIALFDNRKVSATRLSGFPKSVEVEGGETFEAPIVIIATGASWRRLGVPGEDSYIGRGVAFCTHCDGPFYAGKRVAVIGGGNSGIEAALDLAALCPHVDVFEFLDELKADEVLRDRLASLDNVDVHLSSAVTEVVGNGTKVTGLRVKDRVSGEEKEYDVEGVFVQIGLTPNSAPFAGEVEINKRGEIVTDSTGRTGVAGLYAAGDVTDIPYKQIIIAMGEGAKAALSAVDDRMRGITPS